MSNRTRRCVALVLFLSLLELSTLAGEPEREGTPKKTRRRQSAPTAKAEDHTNNQAVKMSTEVPALLNKSARDDRMKEAAHSNTSGQKSVPPPPVPDTEKKAPAGSTTERRRSGSSTENE